MKLFKIHINLVESISLAILFLGMAVVFYAIFYGVGLTNDSRNYLFAAQSFNQQGELLMLGNQPFTEWTPLFPVFLSLFGDSVLFLSPYLQMLIFGLTLFIWIKIISKLIQNHSLRIICFASIAFATPLILIHSFLWSEYLFLLLLTWQILLFHTYLKKQNFKTLLWLAMIGFLYCLQRNTGIFFSVGMALSILFFSTKKVSVSIYVSATYALISTLGFILWNLRSYFVAEANFDSGGNLFIRAFGENSLLYLDVLTSWFLPSQISFWFRFLLLSIVFLILIINHRRFVCKVSKEDFSIKKQYFISILLILSSYFVIMLLLRPSMAVDTERFLSIIYPLSFVLLFSLIDFVFQKITNTLFKKACLVFLLIWLIYPISRSLKNANDWHSRNQVEYSLK